MSIPDQEEREKKVRAQKGARTRAIKELRTVIGLNHHITETESADWCIAWCIENVVVPQKSIAQSKKKSEKVEA